MARIDIVIDKDKKNKAMYICRDNETTVSEYLRNQIDKLIAENENHIPKIN